VIGSGAADESQRAAWRHPGHVRCDQQLESAGLIQLDVISVEAGILRQPGAAAPQVAGARGRRAGEDGVAEQEVELAKSGLRMHAQAGLAVACSRQ